jgi:DNA-nicking Smr family endonuclease
MRRRRSLGPEEKELWQNVARSINPLNPKKKVVEEPTFTPAIPPTSPPAPKLAPFRLGERPAAKIDAPPVPSLRMDAKTHDRMTRGKIAPEARIDLHGMTVAEAHAELNHFILSAQASALRLVLVITGKGKPDRDEHFLARPTGVLRQQVPHWLRLPPLGHVVQQVAQAHLRHGGSGAFYVYLRRR